jgi:hypothetical protein
MGRRPPLLQTPPPRKRLLRLPSDADEGTMTSDGLARRDLLEFVCEPVSGPGRFRERSQHLVLEQRILDAAGIQVGRVTEWSPRLGLKLEQYVPREESLCGVVYDHNDAKILEFVASDGLRRRRFFNGFTRWGRRLEVTDGAGAYVGTLVGREWGRRATVLGNSSLCIGDAKVDGRNYEIDCTITDSTGTEVGWIATPKTHATRLSERGIAVPTSGAKRQRLRTFLGAVPVPDRHFLAIMDSVSPNLRLMMLAISAAIRLGVVDPPPDPNDG